jgi:hypothetical protein
MRMAYFKGKKRDRATGTLNTDNNARVEIGDLVERSITI